MNNLIHIEKNSNTNWPTKWSDMHLVGQFLLTFLRSKPIWGHSLANFISVWVHLRHRFRVRTVPAMIEVSPVRHEQLSPRLHRIDCNCTRTNRAAPTSPNIPNRNDACNSDSYTPAKWQSRENSFNVISKWYRYGLRSSIRYRIRCKMGNLIILTDREGALLDWVSCLRASTEGAGLWAM